MPTSGEPAKAEEAKRAREPAGRGTSLSKAAKNEKGTTGARNSLCKDAGESGVLGGLEQLQQRGKGRLSLICFLKS